MGDNDAKLKKQTEIQRMAKNLYQVQKKIEYNRKSGQVTKRDPFDILIELAPVPLDSLNKLEIRNQGASSQLSKRLSSVLVHDNQPT